MLKFFFFNDTATTEIYTLSLHDALPILMIAAWQIVVWSGWKPDYVLPGPGPVFQRLAQDFGNVSFDLGIAITLRRDRKSTRLNSSHQIISYAVFCLKKKNNKLTIHCEQS